MPTSPAPRRFPLPLLWLLLFVLLPVPSHAGIGFPGSNDSIFPPAKAAAPFINFDGRGFLIRGQRTFLTAGDLHYSRVPRALWHDRLLRLKRLGYNTVQTYVFWSYHEAHEGKFDFTGDRDLDAFLKEIKGLGMYACVRIGPYVNAEWGGGGWPVWLRFKPGVQVRDDNPEFYKYMDRWLGKLMPIVAANQINRGGAVILVQLENEDSRGTGTQLDNAYHRHLRDKCLALGLEVPHWFSGLNHSDDPAGDSPFDYSSQSSPWYTTEFWTGWFAVYGSEERAKARTRATWNVLANGGAGYTHYLAAGGTNFETWGSDQTGASYDFGAPIGQTGDVRDFAYGVKRANLFATTFSRILANSHNTTDQHAGAANGFRVSARSSPAGTILFLKNDGGDGAKAQVKDKAGKLVPTAGPMTLAANEILPIVMGYALIPGVRLDLCAARVLGIATQGDVTTLVVYGPPGDPAEVRFTVPAQGVQIGKSATLTASSGTVVFQSRYPATTPQTAEFKVGPKTVRVLALSSDLADRTWIVAAGGKTWIVCGPDYVGDVAMQDGRLVVQAEQRIAQKAGQQKSFRLYGPGPAQSLAQTARSLKATGQPRVPTLAAWQMAPGDAEAQPKYDDTAWKKSDTPLPMGADGDDSAYAWYRATVQAPQAGSYALQISDAGDWVTAWTNGVHAEGSSVEQRYKSPVARELHVPLKAGDNTLTLLTSHYGRQKLHAYVGPINEIDAKGISGTVTLAGGGAGGQKDITRWRYKADDRGLASAGEMAASGVKTSGPGWMQATIGEDVFKGHVGFAWFRSTLPNVPGEHHSIHFQHVDDNAFVYLNGQKVGEHIGYSGDFTFSLDTAWKAGGPNVLAVLVQNTNGGGGIPEAVTLLGTSGTSRTAPQTVRGWRMRGGVRVPAADAPVWHSLPSSASPTGTPTFYQTSFTATPPGVVGPHPILRVGYAGMSHGFDRTPPPPPDSPTRGFVWVNGHNLGRYPERSPIDGLYVPECWLKRGRNTLVVFDEDGQPPTRLRLFEETAASRRGIELTSAKFAPVKAALAH